MPNAVKISGEKLQKLRHSLAMSQLEFGREMGMTATRVSQIEASKNIGIYQKAVRGLAKLINKPPADVLALLAPEELLVDANVEPYSITEVPEIPMFDLPIAAGKMTELPDSEEMHDPRLLKATRFRVRIRGRSMEKTYKDGSIVEFVCLQFKPDGTADPMQVGKDYYIQQAECATFKRLKKIEDGSLTFVAINRREFPDEIVVHRDDTGLRMARAVGQFVPV